eukprot:COSAG01_NODE_294_length_19294_cov_35.559312_11_plen_77_part_00
MLTDPNAPPDPSATDAELEDADDDASEYSAGPLIGMWPPPPQAAPGGVGQQTEPRRRRRDPQTGTVAHAACTAYIM